MLHQPCLPRSCSLDSSPQSDMAPWPSASQQASPSPDCLDQVEPQIPAFDAPQGDMTGSLPEPSYDPLALPDWNMGEDDTWSSLLGDLGGPVLGGDPLDSGYMDLGYETPSLRSSQGPLLGVPAGEASPLPPLQSAVSEILRPGSSPANPDLVSSDVMGGVTGGASDAQAVSRTGPALADHVRQLILKGSGYSSTNRGRRRAP